MWAVDNRETLSNAGNLWETVVSRVTKQNWAGEEAEKPGQAGISELLLTLSSLSMAQISSYHTSVWTYHGSYMLEQVWFNTCWKHGWAIVNQHSQTPKHGFSNLESWDLDPLLSCASYFRTLFILDFNPLHYLILPACSLLPLLVPLFIFFQVYSYMWWLFLTKSGAYPQSLGETRLVQKYSLITTCHDHLPSGRSLQDGCLCNTNHFCVIHVIHGPVISFLKGLWVNLFSVAL